MITQPRLLAILAGALMLFGLVMFVAREFLVAGVCFLAASLTIYLRETRL